MRGKNKSGRVRLDGTACRTVWCHDFFRRGTTIVADLCQRSGSCNGSGTTTEKVVVPRCSIILPKLVAAQSSAENPVPRAFGLQRHFPQRLAEAARKFAAESSGRARVCGSKKGFPADGEALLKQRNRLANCPNSLLPAAGVNAHVGVVNREVGQVAVVGHENAVVGKVAGVGEGPQAGFVGKKLVVFLIHH